MVYPVLMNKMLSHAYFRLRSLTWHIKWFHNPIFYICIIVVMCGIKKSSFSFFLKISSYFSCSCKVFNKKSLDASLIGKCTAVILFYIKQFIFQNYSKSLSERFLNQVWWDYSELAASSCLFRNFYFVTY